MAKDTPYASKFLLERMDEFCDENKYCADCADYIVKTPDDIGSGVSHLVNTSPNIDVMFTDNVFEKPVSMSFTETQQCGGFIVLDGQVAMQIEGFDEEYVVKKGNLMLMTINKADCKATYSKGRIHMINFYVGASIMHRLDRKNNNFPIEVIKGKELVTKNMLWQLSTTPDMSKIICDICDSKLSGGILSFYINGKIIELLALIYSGYLERKLFYPGIKTYDLNSITKAAEIIEENMISPPSLIELAREVGINDNKLKKLFKKVFNNTVYGYLNEKRMIKARDMLIAGNVSVQQVAEAVGFKHSGYFCRLFKEKFSETPLEFMRKHGDS